MILLYKINLTSITAGKETFRDIEESPPIRPVSIKIKVNTKALANEWARKIENVNAIAPGYIITDNTAPLQDEPVQSEQILVQITTGFGIRQMILKVQLYFLFQQIQIMCMARSLPLMDGG